MMGLKAHGVPARSKRKIWIIPVVLAMAWGGYALLTRGNPNFRHRAGDIVDEFDGVAIYYNGGIHATHGRNRSPNGYNLGIRYQCVEFVKRYYFERHGHRMPDSYGHAKDFFDPRIPDGGWNARRGMAQHANGSPTKPEAGDLVVFRPWLFNRYGHVAIVASVFDQSVEIVQQNPGPWGKTRATCPLVFKEGRWFIGHPRILGWLTLPESPDSGASSSRHKDRREMAVGLILRTHDGHWHD